MQIALTKKLADAMGIKPTPADTITEPLFSWTANWTNTFDRRKEDLVVMVNNATRFTVTIYGIKHGKFKDIKEKMSAAIHNTLFAMNIDPDIIDEYLRRAREIEFTSNNDRKLTAWVNRQGINAAFVVGRAVLDSKDKLSFEDTLGRKISGHPVNYSSGFNDGYYPDKEMIKALAELTGKPAYKYRAFEIRITLDLEVYTALRLFIIPADIKFSELHNLIQRAFSWKNYHLHDFTVLENKSRKRVARLVMSGEDLSYDDEAVMETGHKLSEYFPKHKRILYTYDMGDNWEHLIELVRTIEEHNEESPYLLEAVGQSPPEDVGGVGGFVDFREIMLNPNHPEYSDTKDWAGYWRHELDERETKPRVFPC